MAASAVRKKEKEHIRSNGSYFESVALLLQDGGALGAYQAGVYEALDKDREGIMAYDLTGVKP